MKEPTVAGSPNGRHSRAQFSPRPLGAESRSVPASHLVHQGVARMARTPAGRRPRLLD
jgi:hypothetical protein